MCVQVLLRALRDFNLGKLTADDTGIFMGLLNDIFPKTLESVPRAMNHSFESHVSLWPRYPAPPCHTARVGARFRKPRTHLLQAEG